MEIEDVVYALSHDIISLIFSIVSEYPANSMLQVLRWSALGAGIFYGVYHQAKLSTQAKSAAISRDYAHKQSLIDKAKAEYAKKQLPASAKTEGGDSMFIPDNLHARTLDLYQLCNRVFGL
jgi:F-type H+-transporting ATP synthase subunit e